MKRRTFVVASAGVGTTLLAGCSGGDSSTDGAGGTTGTFRLLISDQPADIEDFDSLEVTLSSARVFRAGDDEEVTTPTATDTASATPEPTSSETADTGTDATGTATGPGTVETADTSEDDDGEGFVEFDLEGTTVDLTTVVGDRAVAVLEDELEEGRYSGIELRVAAVAGVVEGDDVDVMVPSNRLRIVKPFEVGAGAEVSFVFDINVVKKGRQDSYNLLPVIGKSGVAGEDVDVEEVDDDDQDATVTSEAAAATDGGNGN